MHGLGMASAAPMGRNGITGMLSLTALLRRITAVFHKFEHHLRNEVQYDSKHHALVGNTSSSAGRVYGMECNSGMKY